MPKDVELRLNYTSGTVTFAVEGDYLPRWEPVYRFNTNPPQIVEMRQVWEFRGARLVNTTTSGLWTSIASLLGRIGTRGTGQLTSATLVATPSGTPSTLLTLGPSDYEKFAVDVLDGELDPTVPAASWRRSATFTLRLSAVRKFDDARGIVDFEQSVSVTYPQGLRRVELTTTITTKEGVSAVGKAELYAGLDVAAYGSDYVYETGAGASGIDHETEDADQLEARAPTVCRSVSILQQQGVDAGTTSAAGSLSSVLYQVTTERTSEEVRTRTVAQAIGANAEAWVLGRRPAGALARDVLVLEPPLVRGEWEQVTQRVSPTGEESAMTVEVELTGGGAALDWEPVSGGYEPVVFEGGLLPWTARVSVEVERVGGSGRLSELRLPGPPPEPWRFVQAESLEGDPHRVPGERAVDATRDRWRRKALLVFRSVSPPGEPVAAAMLAAPPRATYFYPGQVS